MNNPGKILRNNKIVYESLEDFVLNNSLRDFLISFKNPFLIGQDIYSGNLLEKTIQINNPTMKFHPKSFPEANTDGHLVLNKHLFYLKTENNEKIKEKDKEKNKDVFFHVGRIADNDLVIVDYTISKNHACIIKNNYKYFIKDLGTTNGTMINNIALESNERKKLKYNDVITFGRLTFLFMKPVNVFVFTRVNAGKEDSIVHELLTTLRFIKKSYVEKIANDLNIKCDDYSKKDITKSILTHLTPMEFLNRLF